MSASRSRRAALARAGVGLVGLQLVLAGLLDDPWRVHERLTSGAGGAVVAGVVLLGGAVLSERAARRRVAEALLVDPLTGAGTRAAVARFAAGALARGGAPVTVVRADLDGLDEVHSTLGAAAADELLRQLVLRLRDLSPRATIARLEGASFLVASCELRDGPSALAFGGMVRDALHRPVDVRGLPLGVQAHVGVTIGPDHGDDADALLRRVDLATQRARRGTEPVVLFEPGDELPTPERLALVADLRRAVDAGALMLEYQPVMHLASGRVAGVEALLRWPHPTRGTLPAEEVVALAERSALIRPLTRWVFDEALRQCSGWCDAGSFLSVSVNVSAHCLADDSFADEVECAMLRHGVPAHLVEIELTESAVPADEDTARRVLARLHRLGVNIAIDGFGTGHASLAYLQTLPVDALKIDACFVDGVGHRPGDGTIVRAIVALGRSLGLQVVATGVADDKAERFLLDIGCELGQGYRWARPMGPGDALAWARACDASAERDRERQQGGD